jgi:hypothetical protein
MTHNKHHRKVLEPRLIQRERVQHSLAITAIAALLVSSCNKPELDQTQNEPIDAVFYETEQQCKADIKQQNQNYQTQLAAAQRGELKQTPTPPIMKPEDCAPQLLEARQEHERTAPIYANLQDCQSEGVKCEAVTVIVSEPNTDIESCQSEDVQCEAVTPSASSGYRPVYGGTYFYPYNSPHYSYVNYGGYYRLVYENRPVYASNTPGQVVTAFGQTVSKTTAGRVKVPRYTANQAPQRPDGTSARGTISGRGKQGFGSTFKSTGRGGK